MRLPRKLIWITVALLACVGLGLGYYFFILDWSNRPFCHKQMFFAFETWMNDNGENSIDASKPYPNQDGDSKASLFMIRDEMGGLTNWMQNYNYVPGLRSDDPGELVLLYLNRPTRWTWHGPPASIFKEKAWIIVPRDFVNLGRVVEGPGEMSERISTEQFKRRLSATIDFVRTNQRPHWEKIVEEHTRFLDSIKDSN